MKRTNFLIMSGIGIILLLISACSSGQTSTPEPQSEPDTPDKITVQLSWIHEYSFAQFHNAEKNGHFAEQGLEVTMIEGGFGADGAISSVDEVVNGNAQFGTGNGSDVLVARQEGKPLVAILSILRLSPNSIISLSDAEIVRPQDMIGKTVAVADGGASLIFHQFLGSQDIDPESINIIPRTSYGIDPLISGEVDAIYGWIINESVMIEEAGYTANAIALSDYAIDTYNSLIFTTEDMIKNNPELVQRFVTAVIAGMQDILDDSEASIANTLLFNDELDAEAQLRRLNVMIPLMNTSGRPLGSMEADVWELTHQILLDGGILEEAIDWEAAYTTEFIAEPTEKE